jgi:FG-GAP repeat protein
MTGSADPKIRRLLLTIALPVAVLIIASAVLEARPVRPESVRPQSSHLAGLGTLPAAARGPFAAALGRAESSYAIRGLRAENRPQRLSAMFARRGVHVASGGGRLALSVVAFGRGGALEPVSATSPRVSANRVAYSRGILREWYANGPLGLEQGFDVARSPARGPGPLTLSLALSGNLGARLEHGSVRLSGGGVSLRYGELHTADAHGHALRSWLVVRPRRLEIRVDDSGAAYPLRIDPFIQQAELSATDGASDDVLGYSLAASGDTIVVGAPDHAAGGTGAGARPGAAYVFVKPPSGWANASNPVELTARDGADGDLFGWAVAISGDTIVVGARNHSVGGNVLAGAAYVFEKPFFGWMDATQDAELTASDGAPGDNFGNSVAISGDTIVVGPYQHQVGTNRNQGEAYVFVKPAGGWQDGTQTSRLTLRNGATNDALGRVVAISGDAVVVGAHGRDQFQGAAYVYVKSAGGWTDDDSPIVLTATDGRPNDLFGEAVAISADTIVVGAPVHQLGLSRQGAAYVFEKTFFGWGSSGQTSELSASDGATNDGLGISVGVSGATVLAGAYAHRVGANQAQGATYVFTRPAAGWPSATTQTAELTASDGAAGDVLGFGVAASGSSIFATAPQRSIGGQTRRGAVYVFAQVPAVAIAAPADGAAYALGQNVIASYSCDAPAGATITACAGPVASGSAIDTGSPGSHLFTVTATDDAGGRGTQTVTYTVTAPPPSQQQCPFGQRGAPPHCQSPPTISKLRQSHRTWRAGSRLATISRRHRIPIGTTFSFTLDQRARLLLVFTRHAAGRKVGRRCVAPNRRNQARRSCARLVPAGMVGLVGGAGADKLFFQGRISRARTLKPSVYTLAITAINAAGQRSKPHELRFTVVR